MIYQYNIILLKESPTNLNEQNDTFTSTIIKYRKWGGGGGGGGGEVSTS